MKGQRMGIQKWSDTITVVELSDDPQFTDDVNAVLEELETHPTDVVVNFAGVGFVNSSNVALMLRLRKKMMLLDRRLVLSDITSQVWGVFEVTGLDKVFEFTKDVSTALAITQLTGGGLDEEE
jgi:anti-anti-sigma factor